MAPRNTALPAFHPSTVLRDWDAVSPGAAFCIENAKTHIAVFGATGSGKTSGPAKHIAQGYLTGGHPGTPELGFGGVVLTAKPEETQQWLEWAYEAGREDDVIVFNPESNLCFNFMDWEASRGGEGGGLTINIVALLDEIAAAVAGGAGKAADSGDNRFFEDALHHMNTNLVDLVLFADYPVSLPLLRSLVNSAPQTLAEAQSDAWKNGKGDCAALLRDADARTQSQDDMREDFEECRNYWLLEFPNLSEKTRSIITLSFSMLARPFITRPLRKLFSGQVTTITPEETFDGKILIIDLPVQQYRLAGRVAALAWKYCFQVAILRRKPPPEGEYLRPVFLWWDEGQNYLTRFDSEWHAVARSAGGCSCMLVQTREAMRSVLGNNDAVDALLSNMQCKIFCQSGSVDTNEFASKLIGDYWLGRNTINIPGGKGESGLSMSEQKRRFVEPSKFTTLKRGSHRNGFVVEAVIYNGGEQFLERDTNGKYVSIPAQIFRFNQQH